MPARDRERLVRELERCLAAHAEILEAYLFGSQARRTAKPHSDVDVAVFVDPRRRSEPAFGYAAELAARLSTALGTNSVEVVILNEAPPLLYHRVLRDGVRLLTRDPSATTTREGRALSRYCDYVPQLRKVETAHAARIARGSFGR